MFSIKIEEIRNLIKKDFVKEGLQETEDLLTNIKHITGIDSFKMKEYENQVLELTNRHHRIKMASISGIKSDSKIATEQNKLVHSLLKIVASIEEHLISFPETPSNTPLEFANKISDMEFLIYSSQSKIDMLSSQSISLGNNMENSPKLKELIEVLDKMGLIGEVSDSKPYFYGELNMAWCKLVKKSVIFFSEKEEPNIFLFGSAHHILGNTEKPDPIYNNLSLLNPFLAFFRAFAVNKIDGFREKNLEKNIQLFHSSDIVTKLISKLSYLPKEKLKFVARRYQNIYSKSGKQVIVGSPIFVSLSND